MARTLIFVSILVAHWTAQFLAWSYVQRSGSVRLLWSILATPLVHLNSSITNQYFWVIATFNSALWAAILTYVVARFALRH